MSSQNVASQVFDPGRICSNISIVGNEIRCRTSLSRIGYVKNSYHADARYTVTTSRTLNGTTVANFNITSCGDGKLILSNGSCLSPNGYGLSLTSNVSSRGTLANPFQYNDTFTLSLFYTYNGINDTKVLTVEDFNALIWNYPPNMSSIINITGSTYRIIGALNGSLVISYTVNGSRSNTITLHINSVVPPTSINVTPNSISLPTNVSYSYSTQILPSTAPQTFTPSITDRRIATVSESRLTTLLKEGSTTLNVRADTAPNPNISVPINVENYSKFCNNCFTEQQSNYSSTNTWSKRNVESCALCNIRSTSFVSQSSTNRLFPILVPGTTSFLYGTQSNTEGIYYPNEDTTQPNSIIKTFSVPPNFSYRIDYFDSANKLIYSYILDIIDSKVTLPDVLTQYSTIARANIVSYTPTCETDCYLRQQQNYIQTRTWPFVTPSCDTCNIKENTFVSTTYILYTSTRQIITNRSVLWEIPGKLELKYVTTSTDRNYHLRTDTINSNIVSYIYVPNTPNINYYLKYINTQNEEILIDKVVPSIDTSLIYLGAYNLLLMGLLTRNGTLNIVLEAKKECNTCYQLQQDYYTQTKTWAAVNISNCIQCNIQPKSFIVTDNKNRKLPISIPGDTTFLYKSSRTNISPFGIVSGIVHPDGFALNTSEYITSLTVIPGYNYTVIYNNSRTTSTNPANIIRKPLTLSSRNVITFNLIHNTDIFIEQNITLNITKICTSGSCTDKQKSLTASYLPWNSANLPECENCSASFSGSYDPCTTPKGDCADTQANLTASNIKWTGSSLPQCQVCGSLKQNSFDPCKSKSCSDKKASLTASFQPWNSKSLAECNYCDNQTDSYDPCSASEKCATTQASLTASNVKWKGTDLPECQACGSLKQNSFDPCKSASCEAKKKSLSDAYQPWNSKDLAECNYCDQTGSYDPCSASGDCEKTQTNLTASNVKWNGSDLPQCQTCGSLKQNSFDPCKSASCEAKKKSLSDSYQPWNTATIPECDKCDTLTGSYDPCSASGDCATTQANLTASNVKWSGSDIPQCQACGSLKQNSFDPCKSASCQDKQSFLTKLFQPWNSKDLPECDKCDTLTGSYDPCTASGDCEKTQTSLTASNVKWSGNDLPQCKACGSLKQNSFDPCKSKSCSDKQASLTASFQPWNSATIPECDKCDTLTGSYEPCAPGSDCEAKQQALTASNIPWSGSDLPQCQACGSLKQNSFDPCKSASCQEKQSFLTKLFQPWNSKDIAECNYCGGPLTGSYDPCSASGDCESTQNSLTASEIPWSGSSLAQCKNCEELKKKSWAPAVASSSSSAAPVASSSSSWTPFGSSSSSEAPVVASSSSSAPPVVASSSSSAPPPVVASSSSSFWNIITSIGSSSSSWMPFAGSQPQQPQPQRQELPQPQPQKLTLRRDEPAPPPKKPQTYLPTLPPKPPIIVQLNNVNKPPEPKWSVNYPKKVFNCDTDYKTTDSSGKTIRKTQCL